MSYRHGEPTGDGSRDLEPAEALGGQLNDVYLAFRRLGTPPAEAEELAHEVFVFVWQRWSDYQPERPLRPWLPGIASMVAVDRLGGRGRAIALGLGDEDRPPDARDRMASARARQVATQALAKLSDRQRRFLIRHEIEGRSAREIAAEESLPVSTAADRIRSARERFARAVARIRGGK